MTDDNRVHAYDKMFDEIEPFDLIWCTGVLYHNAEQLRFIRQLFDATAPGGHLVLESAIARPPGTRNANCVEIWYPQTRRRGASITSQTTSLTFQAAWP